MERTLLQRVLIGASGWAQTLPLAVFKDKQKAEREALRLNAEYARFLKFELVEALPDGTAVPVGMSVEDFLNTIGIKNMAHTAGPVADASDVIVPDNRIIV